MPKMKFSHPLRYSLKTLCIMLFLFKQNKSNIMHLNAYFVASVCQYVKGCMLSNNFSFHAMLCVLFRCNNVPLCLSQCVKKTSNLCNFIARKQQKYQCDLVLLIPRVGCMYASSSIFIISISMAHDGRRPCTFIHSVILDLLYLKNKKNVKLHKHTSS